MKVRTAIGSIGVWLLASGCGGADSAPSGGNDVADASSETASDGSADDQGHDATRDAVMPQAEDGWVAESDGEADADVSDHVDGELLDLPSCRGGLDCGGVSCCASVWLPGGSFTMGVSPGDKRCPATEECPLGEGPAHPAKVSAFALDVYEVTVGRYRKFLDAYDAWHGAGNPKDGAAALPNYHEGDDPIRGGWVVSDEVIQRGGGLPNTRAEFVAKLHGCTGLTPEEGPTWTDEPGAHENHPMNCLNFHEAFAFCIWDGGRLPTEAEWEYVATGGDELRRYPWGQQEPDCSRIAYLGTPPCDTRAPHAVGSHPTGQGRWGHQDLAGNLAEWVRDSYTWFPDIWFFGDACIDCVIFRPSDTKAMRGGDYAELVSGFRTSARSSSFPDTRSPLSGVRCARSPR